MLSSRNQTNHRRIIIPTFYCTPLPIYYSTHVFTQQRNHLSYIIVDNSMNMCSKWNFILLFYFTGTIYVAETQEPETLYEHSVDDNLAATSLDKISSLEALPLVLFKDNDDDTDLHSPKRLHKVVIQDGKMINGVEFIPKYPSEHSKQMFFCPDDTSEEKCLMYQPFVETQRLRCASEATPVIQPEHRKCGVDNLYPSFVILYKICDSEEYEIQSDLALFYSICYDNKQQRTLYTTHIIKSPELLNAKLLLREREVNYSMMTKDHFTLFNKQTSDDHEKFNEEASSSQPTLTKPAYTEQKLVPSEDMALALWRKTTFQYTNIALQHKDLINLWNEISGYIRSNAIKLNIQYHRKTKILTGVFDRGMQAKDDDDQMSNYWVKLVIVEKSSWTTDGLAIIMNNFINTKTGHARETVIKQYCQKNLCIETLTEKFAQIGGQIRCCPVQREILKLFGQESKIRQVLKLHIPNINVSANQETLYDDESTFQQAVQSIGPIQPKEILPLILISDKMDFRLHFPAYIPQIEIKNGRIVKGSKFLGKNIGKQLFFCPRVNSNEKCLEPVKFGKFEPLQCAKEATPVAREVPDTSKTCGKNHVGTLYKVVYEPYRYRSKEKIFYEFCYDPIEEKVLYTRHTIKSERLLFSKLLFREREVDYPMLKDVMVPLSNERELEEVATPFTSAEENEDSIPPTSTTSPYKLQKLVPPEDMAFVLWKKTTYQYVNVALQHETLIPLWNKINWYIRDDAHLLLITRGTLMYNFEGNSIYTGVFDIKPTLGNDHKSKIWVKMIVSRRKPYSEGIAILMENDLVSTSYSNEDTLKTYCPENSCAVELQNDFQQIGSRIWCCRLTNQIGELFGVPNIGDTRKLLHIPKITFQEEPKSKTTTSDTNLGPEP